ncbi:hypothetical protein D0A34_08795 [Microcoleus vaginatus PCC 9802]|nr:hypothetical protein D0A34_08795 [Microcoleus vaginatus PCC 9802]
MSFVESDRAQPEGVQAHSWVISNNRLFQITNLLFQIITLIIFLLDYLLIDYPSNYHNAIGWQYPQYIKKPTHTPR